MSYESCKTEKYKFLTFHTTNIVDMLLMVYEEQNIKHCCEKQGQGQGNFYIYSI